MSMTQLRREEIENRVNEILTEIGYVDVVSVNKILEKENIFLYSLDEKDWEKTIKDQDMNRAQALLYKKDDKKVILLNSKEVSNSKISISHEIGHLYLHMNEESIQMFCHHGGNRVDKVQEDEADYFAACLLMPERLVRGFCNKVEKPNLEMFSKIFGVEIETVIRRFQELNIEYSC